MKPYFKYYIQGSDHYLLPRNEFETLMENNEILYKENQELKEKYLNAVADYETTMAEKNELEKQLEDANEKIILLQASEPMLNYKKTLEETQQKEFIKWLEKKQSFLRDEISELTLGMCNTDFQDIKIEIYQEILQRYKEIIGVEDENKTTI